MIIWSSTTLPTDGVWLECNGQSTNGYSELATVVGANVPNYQGVFLRGYGSQTFSQVNGSLNGITSTTYSSGNIGDIQGDAIRNIIGTFGASRIDVSPSGVIYYGSGWSGFIGVANGVVGYGYLDVSRMVPVANENRPVNKAGFYLIKAAS